MRELLDFKLDSSASANLSARAFLNLRIDSGPGTESTSPKKSETWFYSSAPATRAINRVILEELEGIGRITNQENRRINKTMTRKEENYTNDLRQRLRDPAYAAEYLNAVLEDEEEGADAVFLLALRNVAEAFQMSSVAEQAGVNRENLYRMLSGKGNPRLSSLLAVLKALRLHLSVQAN